MRLLLFSLLSIFSLFHFGQQAHQITTLDTEIRETSGLLFIDGDFYTFNDSGGDPELYEIDTVSGSVKRTIKVDGAENKDWEAITTDGQFIYIGDIGNNLGNRKDLVIYKCPIEGLNSGVLQSSEIEISYEDQDDFKHEAHKHEYDAEGLFIRGEKLYLISKNWEKDESKIYEVPMEPGEYELDHDDKIDVFGKVTDAYYSKELNGLFLIGYGEFPFITYLKGFTGKKSKEEITLPINSPNGFQTEGITVVDGKIFYTSEQVQIYDAEMSRFFLSDFDKLVEVRIKGSRIKLKASQKIRTIKIESKKGKKLIKIDDLNKSCKSIPVRALDGKEKVYLKVVLESGAEFKRTITL